MCTRPDIVFATNVTSRHETASLQIHTKQFNRYLNGTRSCGIAYGYCAPHLRATMTVFSDSDWAAHTSTRRSQAREVAMFNGGAITWTSKQHDVVALSTTEAKYVAPI
jgi:hypothetical protein